MFELILSDIAAKFYHSADDKLAGKLNLVFERISENPYYGPNIKKLRGKFEGLYRYRLGSRELYIQLKKKLKSFQLYGLVKEKMLIYNSQLIIHN